MRAITVAVSGALLAGTMLLFPQTAPAAHAAPVAHSAPAALTPLQREGIALNWAETQTGKPYIYGGTGPYGYDCSGLVYVAFQHAGIYLPRTTYGMLASPHLHRVYPPRRGDLAFYGSGHVEFVTIWYHTTFGAHDSGSTIGWINWSGWWHPTAYYRVW